MTWSPTCTLSDVKSGETILLAHGEGGRLSRRLISERIAVWFANPLLASFADAARLPPPCGSLAFSTDSYVVTPLFFPGGDIGSLAVYGTANDLAVSGARPQWLSLSLILEEGLPLAVLDRVLASIAEAVSRSKMQVVTGDTKVVPRGAADQLFINTTGLGELIEPVPVGPQSLLPGDELLVSGPIGRHGIAVLEARSGFGFTPPPQSDCGPLFAAVEALRSNRVPLRATRDATRGGVAAVLHEWATASSSTMEVEEDKLPITDDVRGACELLGLDPLFIACEGTMVIAVPPGYAIPALAALRQCPESAGAAVIGQVIPTVAAPVVVRRLLGRLQPLDEPSGAPLPRIC